MKFLRSLFILVILSVSIGCGRDLSQAKRYSDMKTECDSVIANANQVINQQKSSLDTLWKIRDKWIKSKVSQNRLSVIDKEIADLVTITSNIELIKKHLEAIKTFANVGEKVNKRMIYYKRTYINYSTTIQVHDENIMIQEITEGLSAKKYISKYLPDHKPAGKL